MLLQEKQKNFRLLDIFGFCIDRKKRFFYKNCSKCVMMVTVQEVCAFTALTVRKHRRVGKNPIAAGNFSWIFARDCEGTEQLLMMVKK